MNKRYLSKRTKWLIGASASTLIIIPLIAVSAVACSSEFSIPSISITNKLSDKYLVFGSKSFSSPKFSIDAKSDDHNGSIVYQWYRNNCLSTVSGTPIPGATNSSYIVSQSSILKPEIVYYYAVASIKADGKILNSQISNIAQVDAINLPLINIKNQPTNQIAPAGETENLPVFSANAFVNNPNITLKYQWYKSDSASINEGIPISGATNKFYKTTKNEVFKKSKEYFFVKINAMINGVKLISKDSNLASLNVESVPTINITNNPATDQKLIAGQTTEMPKLSVSVSNHSGTKLTYQWYENSNNSTNGGTAIQEASQPAYTISSNDVKTPGTKYYYVKISGSANNGVILKPVFSSISKIIISPTPTIKINSQPQNVSAIATQTQNLPVLSVNASTTNPAAQLHYQWYTSASKANTDGSVIVGATNSTYHVTASETKSSGNKYFYVKISGTINGIKLNSVTSNLGLLNTEPVPTITIISQPKVLKGDVLLNAKKSPTLSITAISSNPNVPLVYQWFKEVGIGHSSSGGKVIAIPGANKPTYTVPTNKVGQIEYYVLVSFAYGIQEGFVYSRAIIVTVVANNGAITL